MASEGGGRGTDEAGPAVMAATGRPGDVAGEGGQARDTASGNTGCGGARHIASGNTGWDGARQGHRGADTGAAHSVGGNAAHVAGDDRATDGRVEGGGARGATVWRPAGNIRTGNVRERLRGRSAGRGESRSRPSQRNRTGDASGDHEGHDARQASSGHRSRGTDRPPIRDTVECRSIRGA